MIVLFLKSKCQVSIAKNHERWNCGPSNSAKYASQVVIGFIRADEAYGCSGAPGRHSITRARTATAACRCQVHRVDSFDLQGDVIRHPPRLSVLSSWRL